MCHGSSFNKRVFLMLLSAIAVMVCFAVLQISSVFAEEASEAGDLAQKYKITFPVSTLGNCNSLVECKEYCSDVAHKDACEAFAKSKGFYKAPQGTGNARSRLILQKAKEELGCDSDQACKAFCKEEANKEICKEFAKKYKLEGGSGKGREILEKAKEMLGCTSEESCKAFCQDETNRQKCSEFAKAMGLIGGIVKVNSSGKNQAGFEQVKMMIEQCKKNPGECEQNIATLEAELFKKSDEFCKANSEKCKELDDIRPPKLASDSSDFRRPIGVISPDQFKNFNSGVQGVSATFWDKILQFFR